MTNRERGHNIDRKWLAVTMKNIRTSCAKRFFFFFWFSRSPFFFSFGVPLSADGSSPGAHTHGNALRRIENLPIQPKNGTHVPAGNPTIFAGWMWLVRFSELIFSCFDEWINLKRLPKIKSGPNISGLAEILTTWCARGGHIKKRSNEKKNTNEKYLKSPVAWLIAPLFSFAVYILSCSVFSSLQFMKNAIFCSFDDCV